MITIRLLLLAALLGVPALAAEPKVETAPVVDDKAAKLADTRDAFLAFARDKAKTYTDKAEVAAGKAIDLIAKESPLAVAEFLRWRAWMHGLKGLFPLALLAGGLLLMNFHWGRYEFGGYYGNQLKKGTELNVAGFVIGAVGSLVAGISFTIAGFSHLLNLTQLLVAPRIYLIEQVLHQFGK